MKNLPKDKDAGIRKLPNNVQEKMGYDPLSQERSMIAGGSRPMHQASTVQIDPMTGLPLQANAPNMGNFGGAMGMSNVPMYDQSMSPGAIAQQRKKYSKEILTRPMTSEQLENYESAVTSYKDSTNAWVNNQGPEPKIPDYTSFKLNPAEKAGQAAGKFGLKATAKLPQEKTPIIPPQNPGVYKGVDLNKPLPVKADFYGAGGKEYDNPELKKGIVGKETSPSAHTALDQSELFWRKTAHNVASDKTESGKGISGKGLGELMHLERHGQTSRLQNGPLSSPTEKIKKGFKKGWEETYAKPKS